MKGEHEKIFQRIMKTALDYVKKPELLNPINEHLIKIDKLDAPEKDPTVVIKNVATFIYHDIELKDLFNFLEKKLDEFPEMEFDRKKHNPDKFLKAAKFFSREIISRLLLETMEKRWDEINDNDFKTKLEHSKLKEDLETNVRIYKGMKDMHLEVR